MTPNEIFFILDNIWLNATVLGEYVQYTDKGVEEDIDFGDGWHLIRVSEGKGVKYIVKYYQERAEVTLDEKRNFDVKNSKLVYRFLDWAENEGWW